MEAEKRFPLPSEVNLPQELEGWEEMYPKYFGSSENLMGNRIKL